MQRSKRLFGAAGVSVALFALAFVVAPWSCAGGVETYGWSGIAALGAMLALPFVACTGDSLLARAGLGFALLAAVVWLAGLFAANVRILCRLI